MTITIQEARKILWPDYDKLSDEEMEKLVFDCTALASLAVDAAQQEMLKEKEEE